MSDSSPPPESLLLPQRPSRAGAVIFTLIGIVLLLPGMCAIAGMVIMADLVSTEWLFSNAALDLLWLVCLTISVGGILLIVRVWRG